MLDDGEVIPRLHCASLASYRGDQFAGEVIQICRKGGSMKVNGEILKKRQLCEWLGISLRCVENMVKRGEFPPPVRVGKFAYWSQDAVDAWLQRHFGAQDNWQPPQ